jgi:uncharacterized protein YxjI
VSCADNVWIENGRGEKVYKVDGKALRVRGTLIFEDRAGREMCKIQEKILRMRVTLDIQGSSGAPNPSVEIEPGQNDILILAATVAIDMISHPGR